LAPLLDDGRRRIELVNAILLTLPGTPIIYYGDEIGMGDNIYLGDRNGVRTPMQWSGDRNAGFSRANPQKLYLPVIIDPEYHYEAVNVETQQSSPNSLLWWMKHLIEQRKRFKAFGRGSLEFLRPTNRKVLAFYRRYQDETLLIVATLSRFPQHVELDLSAANGMTPVEVFGRAEFPPITDQFYNLTLGSLGFYWFSLEPRRVHQESVVAETAPALPAIEVPSLDRFFQDRGLRVLLARLPGFLKSRRWFQGRDRTIRSIEFADSIPIPDTSAHLLFGRVEYSEGDPEVYVLPGSVAQGDAAERVKRTLSDGAVAEIKGDDGSSGVLYSAVWDSAFCDALLSAIARRRSFRGKVGELVGSHNRTFRKVWGQSHPELGSAVWNIEQTNTAIVFGNRFWLKVYRRIQPGMHPEIEQASFLTDKGFPHAAPLTGTVEYRTGSSDPAAVAALFGFVENQGDAWNYTLDSLGQFFEGGLAGKELEALGASRHPLELQNAELPAPMHELAGAYLDAAHLMGRRTAELHLALSDSADPAFSPEPFTDHYRQALQHSLIALVRETGPSLRSRSNSLPESARADAKALVEQQDKIRAFLRQISDQRVPAVRIRIHDDLQLKRFLHTGKDFVFVGFEGRPDRALSERRIKRSPWRDVASMIMSFYYAADAVFHDQVPGIKNRPEILPVLQSLSRAWFEWTSAMFLKGYRGGLGDSVLASSDANSRILLDTFLWERALEEIEEQLQLNDEWIGTPLRLLRRILDFS
ncbi:MAG TPA: alpha-glucosidase C-terminal domain-containing protein, partial [Blastocatellia bacterium]|nr:alpha-glucosidase C-terminal domain-containing protein [Blastocatellia bacterium]